MIRGGHAVAGAVTHLPRGSYSLGFGVRLVHTSAPRCTCMTECVVVSEEPEQAQKRLSPMGFHLPAAIWFRMCARKREKVDKVDLR